MFNPSPNVVQRIRGLSFGDIKARHISDVPLSVNRPYLVKGLLLPKQISILAAPPNTGKSCIVAALLAKLSQGHSFAGRRVRRSRADHRKRAPSQRRTRSGQWKGPELRLSMSSADARYLFVPPASRPSPTQQASAAKVRFR